MDKNKLRYEFGHISVNFADEIQRQQPQWQFYECRERTFANLILQVTPSGDARPIAWT